MKSIGRIILLVVGGCLVGFSIPTIVECFKTLDFPSWTFSDILNLPEKFDLFKSLIFQFISVLVGLTALLAGIKGKATFWLIIFALVFIVGLVYFIIGSFKGETYIETSDTFVLVSRIVFAVSYFAGSVLVLIGNK